MTKTALICISFLILGCTKENEIASEYPKEVSQFASEVGPGLPYHVGKDLRPEWKLDGEQKPRSLEAFALKDQQGKLIKSEMLKGRITIVSFFYATCPGICPMTTRNLKAVQDKIKDDDRFQILSFSVTPEKDTPEKLKTFARKNSIDYRRWKLATGDRKQIYSVARNSFSADTFSEKENEKQQLKPEDFLHSENVYLLDEEQKLRGIYQGKLISSMDDLIRDAESLVK